MLVGHSPGLNHNEFLSTTRPYGDFVLSLYFRMIDGKGNSGVQFRSVRIPNHEMSGYQADIGEGLLGLALRRVAPKQGAGAGQRRMP